MATEGVLATLYKLTTALSRLDELAEDVHDFRVAATARIDRLEGQVADLRELHRPVGIKPRGRLGQVAGRGIQI